MTTVYLIRHAEAEGNLYRRFQGWYNSLITERGYRQIAALEKRFADVHIDAVYSSDLFRAMTTAGAIYKPKGLELHTDPHLRELHGGVWEDHTWGELYRANREELARFYRSDPGWKAAGGESYPETQRRVSAAVRRIARSHDGETIAIVSHGSAILCAMSAFLHKPMSQVRHGDNTCVAKLRFIGERVEVDYFNDTTHLPPSLRARRSIAGFLPENYGINNVWFRPLDMEREGELYISARREGWQTSHGTLEGFDGGPFLDMARANSAQSPRNVLAAMAEDSPAGILQMDEEAGAGENVGFIWFLYLFPECRGTGMSGQLLGQAISRFRSLGRKSVRLRCALENRMGQKFYRRHGFREIGRVAGGMNELLLLEKDIEVPKTP